MLLHLQLPLSQPLVVLSLMQMSPPSVCRQAVAI